MFDSYVIKGLLMGLVFGVPAGAIGVLTIQNSLRHGFLPGFTTGLGASFADLLYAIISVLGLAAISDMLLCWQTVLGICGGSLIIVLGLLNFLKKRTLPESKQADQGKTVVGPFVPSFVIAIMNPATILSFFVAFAAFGIAKDLSVRNSVELVAGIFLGTSFWWAGLSGLVSVFRKRVTRALYTWLNRVFGFLLIAFGLVVIVGAIF